LETKPAQGKSGWFAMLTNENLHEIRPGTLSAGVAENVWVRYPEM
jgi:hypothetical protein